MKRNLIYLFLCVVMVSCGKDPSGIQDVPVNFHALLADQSMNALNRVNGYVEVSGYGVAGLIIYNSAFSGYVAYDRCSTVNPAERCIVKVDATGITATDPCSRAVFSLEDGTPQNSNAKMPLKRYAVSVSRGYLSVTN